MALCIVLCNIHGLIFLPAFLIVFDALFERCKSHAHKLMPKGSNTVSDKKQPIGLPQTSNGKRNGHKRNGVVPDNKDKNTDRPDISSSPEVSPRPNETRKVLQPAEPRRTPSPNLQLDESRMTDIDLNDPTPTTSSPSAIYRKGNI